MVWPLSPEALVNAGELRVGTATPRLIEVCGEGLESRRAMCSQPVRLRLLPPEANSLKTRAGVHPSLLGQMNRVLSANREVSLGLGR